MKAHLPTLPLLLVVFFAPLLLVPGGELFAQNGLPSVAGTRGRALGGTGLTFVDTYAAWTNPAGLAKLNAVGGNVSGEQRFGLSELQNVGLGVGLPAAGGGLGLTFMSFGYATLRENRVGLSYGRSLARNFRVGGEIVGHNLSVEGYDSRFAATFSLGMQLDIIPELSIGFRAFSLLRVETAEQEYLPQLLSVGLGYRPNDKMLVMAEVHQDLDVAARVHIGLEYLVTEKIDLRLGVTTGPAELSFGAGFWATDNIRVEIAGAYHETLGVTPGVGLAYRGQ